MMGHLGVLTGGPQWFPIRLVPAQLANSLGLNKWIKTMASTGQSKICIFWRDFSHWTFYIQKEKALC